MTATVLHLYEIATEYEKIGLELTENGGELTEELEARLNEINDSFDVKVENTALYIRNLEATAEAECQEADKFADRAKAKINAANRLKAYIKAQMERVNATKVETLKVKARIQKNGRPSITWEPPVEDLPAALQKVTTTLDGTAAYAAYKDNCLPEGFNVNHGTHLRLS